MSKSAFAQDPSNSPHGSVRSESVGEELTAPAKPATSSTPAPQPEPAPAAPPQGLAVITPALETPVPQSLSAPIKAPENPGMPRPADIDTAAMERDFTKKFQELDQVLAAQPRPSSKIDVAPEPKFDAAIVVIVQAPASKEKSSPLGLDAKAQEEKPSLLFAKPAEKELLRKEPPTPAQAADEKKAEAVRQVEKQSETKPTETKLAAYQRQQEVRDTPKIILQERLTPEREKGALETVRERKQERVAEIEANKRNPDQAPSTTPAALAPQIQVSPPALGQFRTQERSPEHAAAPPPARPENATAVRVLEQTIEKAKTASTHSEVRVEVVRTVAPAEGRVASIGAPATTQEVITQVVSRRPAAAAAATNRPIEVLYRFVAAVRERINPGTATLSPNSSSSPLSSGTRLSPTGNPARQQETRTVSGSTVSGSAVPGSPVSRSTVSRSTVLGSSPAIPRIPSQSGQVNANLGRLRGGGDPSVRVSQSRDRSISRIPANGLPRDAQGKIQDPVSQAVSPTGTSPRTESRTGVERMTRVHAAHLHADKLQTKMELRRSIDNLGQMKTIGSVGSRISRLLKTGQLIVRQITGREKLEDKLRFTDGTPVEKIVREVARAVKNLFQPLAADTEPAPIIAKDGALDELPIETHELIPGHDVETEAELEAEVTLRQILDKERFPKLDPLKDEPIAIYTIRGNVFDNDSGIPRAGVVIRSGLLGTTVTDSNGDYRFDNVPEGTFYVITAYARSIRFHPAFASGTVSGHTTRNFRAISK